MEAGPAPVTFGAVDDADKPLAVLVHGFPDTPNTWRHLGPQLAAAGYRVVAPWLPGYAVPAAGPVSVGTYVRHIQDERADYRGDENAVLVGHDWGANAGYGAVTVDPRAFRTFVALAVPPAPALGAGIFSYPQLKRSFYIWLIQQVGLAEGLLLQDGFWESLWADWSPGYASGDDIAALRRSVTAETVVGVLNPYRASFNPAFADPATEAEAIASLSPPPVPTLYLHGTTDGAVGADLLTDVGAFLPAEGSAFELLDGVGHFLHLEEPHAVGRRIVAWLTE